MFDARMFLSRTSQPGGCGQSLADSARWTPRDWGLEMRESARPRSFLREGLTQTAIRSRSMRRRGAALELRRRHAGPLLERAVERGGVREARRDRGFLHRSPRGLQRLNRGLLERRLHQRAI